MIDIAERLAATELTHEEIRRYGRHLTLPQVGALGQKRLKASRVLLVGTGGLGSPLGLYLAAAGVGTLGLVDDDRVDETNLQRQVLYGTSDLGRPKVEAAAERLRDVNPFIEIETHRERLTAANARELVRRYDVVVDGSDNFPTRYLVNDACVLEGKPNVWGAILRFEGQLSVFWGERGPCYRCLFPEPPPPGMVPSCAEGGVLGVLPGIVGSLQANETLKLLIERGEPMIGRLLLIDALSLRFREMKLKKSRDCPICGPNPTQTTLVEYSTCAPAVAGPEEKDDVGGDGEIPFEIQVEDLKAWLDEGREVTLLDVREPYEYEICHLEGSRLLPMGDVAERWDELPGDRPIVALCHHGPRSSRVVAFLRNQGLTRTTNLAGGIDAWSLRIDPSVPRY